MATNIKRKVRVRVLAFARLREVLGYGERELEVALPATLEQGQAQLSFERHDLSAQRGLRDMKQFGGAPDILLLGHSDEVAQLAKLEHISPHRS